MACKRGEEDVSGEVFNIAYGKRVTINELISFINRLLDTNINPINANPRPGDVKHSLANIGKARQFLDYEPKVSLYNGLKNIISIG